MYRGKWNEYIYWDSFGGEDVNTVNKNINSPQPHNQNGDKSNNDRQNTIETHQVKSHQFLILSPLSLKREVGKVRKSIENINSTAIILNV